MHIWTVSWWKDYKSIKKFAGEDYENAMYYEEDKKYLLNLEPHVKHAEVTVLFYKFRNNGLAISPMPGQGISAIIITKASI